MNLNLTDFSYAIIAAFQFTNNQYESILSITGMRRNNMKQTVNVSRYRRLIEKQQAKAEVRLNVWNSSAILYVITTLHGN